MKNLQTTPKFMTVVGGLASCLLTAGSIPPLNPDQD